MKKSKKIVGSFGEQVSRELGEIDAKIEGLDDRQKQIEKQIEILKNLFHANSKEITAMRGKLLSFALIFNKGVIPDGKE